MPRCRNCGKRIDDPEPVDNRGDYRAEDELWDDLLDSVFDIDAQEFCPRCRNNFSVSRQIWGDIE